MALMGRWKIGDYLFDPELKRQGVSGDYNPLGAAEQVEAWVPWEPGCFAMHAQPESLRGLVYPSQQTCLDAMEAYIRALDPSNWPSLFNGSGPYHPWGAQGEHWAPPSHRQEPDEEWEDGGDPATGRYDKVTDLRIERKKEGVLLTSRWAEWMPPGQWEDVQWNTANAYNNTDPENIVSERTFEHTARKLLMFWGAKP